MKRDKVFTTKGFKAEEEQQEEGNKIEIYTDNDYTSVYLDGVIKDDTHHLFRQAVYDFIENNPNTEVIPLEINSIGGSINATALTCEFMDDMKSALDINFMDLFKNLHIAEGVRFY